MTPIVVLVTNARRPDDRQTLVLATDRYTRFLTDAAELTKMRPVLEELWQWRPGN